MVTNKALTELKLWACAAHEGRGERAKQHLVTFAHVAAGIIASTEFRQRCEELYGQHFDPGDLDRTTKFLDAIANIEVRQTEVFGSAQA